MAGREVVTRTSLRRELVVNAATKPLPVVVAAAVAVGAFVLGTAWLLAVAAVLYVALSAATFFDEVEAAKVGRATYERARGLAAGKRELPKGLPPEIAALVARARVEERRILEAIAESDMPFADVSAEVDSLTTEMERIARRAHVIVKFLDDQPAAELRGRLHALRRDVGGTTETERARDRAVEAVQDQIRVRGSLEAELVRFAAEMEHLIASLGVVHGQLVRVSVVGDTTSQEAVAAEVRDLRERVGAVAEAMQETVAQLGEADDAR